MAWRYMYSPTITSLVRDGGNNVAVPTGDNRTKDSDYGSNSTALAAMYDQNYITNTLYYNPNQTYRGWQSANGTYMADDTYDSVSTSNTHLTGTLNLNGEVQTFYMPPTTGALNDARLYTRYTLLTNNTAQRCTWNATNRNFTTTGNCTTVSSFTWPSGTTRTLAQEKINFANWYTYHRTRTKVAKAGVSYAFNDTSIFNADNAYRVGFTTIWQRDEYRIPVASDNGLFRNTNRSDWFDRLFNATASNGTPLKAALIRAGQYYEETGNTGDRGVARRARPLIGLMDDAEIRRQARQTLRGVVARAVVDDDGLEIAKALPCQRRLELVDEAPAIVAGHDDADGRRAACSGHGAYSSWPCR